MEKRIPTLEDFITESKNEKDKDKKYSYGCLMVYLEEKGWDGFIKDLIDENDIVEEDGLGIETEPHVTVLYGFHEDTDVDKLKELVPPLSEIKISADEISIFENEKYDVLKYDIKSDKLFEVNKLMTDNFEYTTDFPDYHPHATIAYLKKGTGKKYASKLKEDKEFSTLHYVYSQPSGEKVVFKK